MLNPINTGPTTPATGHGNSDEIATNQQLDVSRVARKSQPDGYWPVPTRLRQKLSDIRETECYRSEDELVKLCDSEVITDPAELDWAIDYANGQAEAHRKSQIVRTPNLDVCKEKANAENATSGINGFKTEDFPDFPRGGGASAENLRTSMEDAHLAQVFTVRASDRQISIPMAAVFDGHNCSDDWQSGSEASSFARDRIVKALTEQFGKQLEVGQSGELSDLQIRNALHSAMVDVGGQMENYESGTTACVSMIVNGKLWTANVGDSRGFVVNDSGSGLQVSTDANVADFFDSETIQAWSQQEPDRIGFYISGTDTTSLYGVHLHKHIIKKTAYNTVCDLLKNGEIIGRFRFEEPSDLEGKKQCFLSYARIKYLSVYRVWGDFKLHFLSSAPTITAHEVSPDMKWLVVCCDGIFSRLTTNNVSSLIHDQTDENPGATGEQLAGHVVTAAFHSGSRDNLSAVILPIQDMLAQSKAKD